MCDEIIIIVVHKIIAKTNTTLIIPITDFDDITPVKPWFCHLVWFGCETQIGLKDKAG